MKIRDKRSRGWFWGNNEFIDEGYSNFLGPGATSIYFILCKYADNDLQTCFPSIETLANRTGSSKSSVIRYLKSLEKYGLISIKREKNIEDKRQKNNEYTLLDKSEWVNIDSRVPNLDSEKPGVKNDKSRVSKTIKSRVSQLDRNYTHINKTENNETHSSEQSSDQITPEENKQISAIIEAFTLNGLEAMEPKYMIPAERKAAYRLLSRFGLEKVMGDLKVLGSRKTERFCPVVTKPTELERNYSRVMMFLNKNQNVPPVLPLGTVYTPGKYVDKNPLEITNVIKNKN